MVWLCWRPKLLIMDLITALAFFVKNCPIYFGIFCPSARAVITRSKKNFRNVNQIFSSAGTFTYTVVADASLTVKIWGAGGNNSLYDGGGGAFVGTFNVKAGDVITALVGGSPGGGSPSGPTAMKIVRGSIVASAVVGAGGSGGDSSAYGGAGSGGFAAESGGSNPDSGAGGGGAGGSSSGGTAGSAGSGGNNGVAGSGPFNFTTMTGGTGGSGGVPSPIGALGGAGGGGLYGGGSGGSGDNGVDTQAAGGGGGSGNNSGFISATNYQGTHGDGITNGVAGNPSDADRPTNAGNATRAGAVVLKFT
jgi:hypothetical protein